MSRDTVFSLVRDVWEAMPPFLQQALLLSGDAGPRLLDLAEELLENLERTSRPELLSRVVADMALSAWEASFFDTRAASVISQIDAQIPVLPDSVKAFAQACARSRPLDMDVARCFEDAFAEGDMVTVRALLESRRVKEGETLFWLRFARYFGLRLEEADWYESWLSPRLFPRPVFMALKGELAFARNRWEDAAKFFEAAYAGAPLADFLCKRGECLHRAGNGPGAVECWQQALAARPWQVNLFLRLTDNLLGLDVPSATIPEGRGKILLYTWNHGPDLDAAMAALAASDRGETGIILLDNGSTDNTPNIAAAWKERLGSGLDLIRLPTNVGAPAARNWLLELEETRKADWVVFLDDDALVPPDWLHWFGAALKAYPGAEIAGCRIVEQAAPLTVQNADLHFDAGGRESEQGRAERHLSGGSVLLPHALDCADFGQFSYARPCMSVTGCCHLLTGKSIERTGLFDLRFSPSQFDDFERDLRAALAGARCVYQGHLAVRHVKRSGAMAGMSAWQRSNVGGNMFKLWNSYSNEQVEALIDRDNRNLREDFFSRLQRVEVF